MAAFDSARFEDEFLTKNKPPAPIRDARGYSPEFVTLPPPRPITPRPKPTGPPASLRAKLGLLAVVVLMAGGTTLIIRHGGVHLPTPAPSACELHWQNDYVMKDSVTGLSHSEYLARCNSTSDARLIQGH